MGNSVSSPVSKLTIASATDYLLFCTMAKYSVLSHYAPARYHRYL